MPRRPVQMLGHYRLLEEIGRGGMGRVYLAEDTRLGRRIALKVLPDDVAADPDRLRRFETEARTAAALNHPNIVTLHSVEQDGGTRFITMELVRGQPLSRLGATVYGPESGEIRFGGIIALSSPGRLP